MSFGLVLVVVVQALDEVDGGREESEVVSTLSGQQAWVKQSPHELALHLDPVTSASNEDGRQQRRQLLDAHGT